MNDVAADREALRAFVEATDRWSMRLVERRDQLATQRLAITTELSSHDTLPAIGQLDQVIDHWTETAALVARVGTGLFVADQPPALDWSTRHGLFWLQRPAHWSNADVDRMVQLGEERTRLRRLAALDTPQAIAAHHQLAAVEAEMTELSALMDRVGWSEVAYAKAGIDRGWDPADGLLDNDANVRGIYGFYGDLYLEDPDLLWAGMAGLVGRQLYAGWQDLYTARHLLDEGSRMKYLLELAGLPTGPDEIYDVINLAADLTGGGSWLFSPLQSLATDDLEWLETKMLSMAKEIFDDVGWKHIAYHYGGIDALESALAGPHSWDVRALFRMVGSGDPDLVWRATQGMIVREQRDTIQDDWDEIHGRHGLIGEAITEFLTWTADNPIPGGRPYREVMTEPSGITIPFAELPEFNDLDDLSQPFPTIGYRELQGPKGNVANYNDRKAWIDLDIGPAFQRLAADRPEELVGILESPFDSHVSEQRLHPMPYPGGRS